MSSYVIYQNFQILLYKHVRHSFLNNISIKPSKPKNLTSTIKSSCTFMIISVENKENPILDYKKIQYIQMTSIWSTKEYEYTHLRLENRILLIIDVDLPTYYKVAVVSLQEEPNSHFVFANTELHCISTLINKSPRIQLIKYYQYYWKTFP